MAAHRLFARTWCWFVTTSIITVPHVLYFLIARDNAIERKLVPTTAGKLADPGQFRICNDELAKLRSLINNFHRWKIPMKMTTIRLVTMEALLIAAVMFCSACQGPAEAAVRTKAIHVKIPQNTEPLIISAESVYIASDWTPPQMRPEAPTRKCWTHRKRSQRQSTLAERDGDLIEDTFGTIGAELTRQVWIARAADSVALRVKLLNRSNEPIQLDALIPLQCSGAQALTLGGSGAENWQMLVQKRFKGSVPTSLNLGDKSQIPGKGAIEADPFCLLRPASQPEGPVLLFGYVSWLGHCARVLAQFKTDDGATVLNQLTAECEFDACIVPPGGEKTSQWLLLRVGADSDELVADFADRVGCYHGVKKPPEPPPTAACSWYFHYRDFGEKEFIRTLEYLAKNPLEFDVFLIDDSWDRTWGNWLGNDKWPSGMKAAAEKIKAAGFRPGIWTCPLVAHPASAPAIDHPQWMLRLEDGSLYKFGSARPNFILDPTCPGVCEHLEALYRRLRYDWGYTYFKLDFMQEIIEDRRLRFYDRTATPLDAYRRALEAIRRGAGPDAYISVCGGHYGGSIGIANGQRTGSDMKPGRIAKTAQQNILRNWMNRLWHTNPDSLLVRRPSDAPGERLTNAQTRTSVLNQYLGGGMVKLSFVFEGLDDYTRALYRHIIPSANSPAIASDPFESGVPCRLVTRIRPRCKRLDPWVTLAYINWTDKTQSMKLDLSPKVLESMQASKFLVFDFFSQRVLGIFELGAELHVGTVGSYDCGLLRIAPWHGTTAVLAGTDLHFSGGGVEVVSWDVDEKGVSGKIETRWHDCPVSLTVAFPADLGYRVKTVRLGPGQTDFRITAP